MQDAALVSDVASHYDAFPFPHVRDDLGGLAVSVAALPQGGTVWIAGCGTLQAARWGRAFPYAEITATDVSAKTIAVAQEVAHRHSVNHISFSVGDMQSAGFSRQFDLVVCTGVIHHLPDPTVGLRAVALALRPKGRALLMVYSRSLRTPLAALRSEVFSRSGPHADPQDRFAVAEELLCNRSDKLGLLLKRLAGATPSIVADAIANPIEHHYDAVEIPALLDGTGLTFDHWLHEPAIDLEPHAFTPQLEFLARLDTTPQPTTKEAHHD